MFSLGYACSHRRGCGCHSWLYVDGTDPKTINPDPWQYNGFGDYNHGTKLKDESCKPMAAYMARLVGHYTAGGHHDDVRNSHRIQRTIGADAQTCCFWITEACDQKPRGLAHFVPTVQSTGACWFAQ